MVSSNKKPGFDDTADLRHAFQRSLISTIEQFITGLSPKKSFWCDDAPYLGTYADQKKKIAELGIPKFGDLGPDGFIYAGVSDDPQGPGYRQPLWVAPRDSGVMTHYEATVLAETLPAQRLPTL